MKPKLSESTNRLGTAPLWKLLISLSLPGMVAMVTMTLYHLVDTFWVAKLGHEAIAALTIIMPLQIIVVAVALGSGIGIGSLTSRRFGERDINTTNHIAGHVFAISALFGGIFVLLFTGFTEPLLILGGATPDIMDYAAQYLTIIAFGAPFMVFSMNTRELLRGSGDALRPMIFSIIPSVMNMILDPCLIFGLGPFPEMGIAGAALATVISQFTGALLAFMYIVVLRRSAFQIKLWHINPSLSILRDIYSVGFPTMIIEFTQSATFILLNQVISNFGSVALAARGLAMRIINFAHMPVFGASQGLLPIIGFNYGSRLLHRLWGSVRLASLGLAVILGVFTIFAVIFSAQLIGIFTDEPELIDQGITAVRILLSMVFIFGPSYMFITTFMGLGKGKDVFFLSIIRQLFFILSLLILPHLLGINGAWMSTPVADLAGFIISGFWLFREYNRHQKLTQRADLNAEVKLSD